MRLSFEAFDVDLEAGQLIVAGQPVALERRAFEMLRYLAQHPNRFISKDELLSEVWNARALSDGAVMNAAAKLRKALGQLPGASAPIETLRGRGYRLHAVSHAATHATPAAHAADAAPEDPFVGRTHVLQTLEQVLDDALRGQGQLVLLSGDAGMGKTRTLDELAKRARTRGYSVWEGAAYDGGGAPAYWTWIQIIRAAHADLSRAMFRRHLADEQGALALLAPELFDARSGVAFAAASGDGFDPRSETTRFRLFDELARFLSSASSAAPCLVIADDAHWADAGTLELFAYAARALKKRPVVLALALREHVLADDAAQAARAELLSRIRRAATQLVLSGLAAAEVGQLIAALAPQQALDAALYTRLHERTQGNPFFVRQLLALLTQGGSTNQHQDLEQLELPRAVRDLLQQRVAALPAQTQALLRMAATLGSEFELSVLVAALDQPASEVLQALQPALVRAVVVRVAREQQRFAFGHALLRDTTYESLTALERGTLHAQLARVLAQRSAGADARALGELARHHLLALPPQLDACVHYCELAAKAARAALGYEAAAELLTRACDKLANEGGDARTRCQLLLALGSDRFCGGDVRNGWLALRQGAHIAQQLGAADLLAQFACRLAAWLELGGGDEDEVRALIDRALAELGETDSDLRASLLAHRAEIHFELPAVERYALLAEADALAARQNTPLVQLELALIRASLRDPTRLDEARDALLRYRALARTHRHALDGTQRLLREFSVELGEYVRAMTACEVDAADGVIERCRSIAEQTQVAAVALGVELMRASRALGDGRLDALGAAVQRLRDGSSLSGGFSLVWASYAMRLLEEQDGLRNLAGFAADTPSGFEALRPTQQMYGRLWLARLNVKLGAHDKARALVASIPSEQIARMPVRYGDLGMLCFLAEIYVELADPSAASALYEKLLPFAERNAVGAAFDYCGAVAHYLGLLAALLGQPEQAATHFERAEAINRRLRMPLQAGRSASLRDQLNAARE